jgi:hypothetical protein
MSHAQALRALSSLVSIALLLVVAWLWSRKDD